MSQSPFYTNQFFLIVILLFFGVNGMCQNGIPQKSLVECINSLEKINEDYIFKINGSYHFEKSDIYICENDFPLQIEILKNELGYPPLPYSPISWEKTDKDLIFEYKADLKNKYFRNRRNKTICNIKCKFNENPNTTIELKINVLKNAKYKFSDSDNDVYDTSFDDNKIKVFPGYLETVPNGIEWKLLRSGINEKVKVTIDPEKSKSVAEFPIGNIINSKKQEITISSSSTTPSVEIYQGCNLKNELYGYVISPKSTTIQFFTVCDITSSGSTICAPTINETMFINEANIILEKAGLSLNNPISIMTITSDFDQDDNGIFEVTNINGIHELSIIGQYVINNSLITSDIGVFIVDDLEDPAGAVKRGVSFLGLKRSWLDGNLADAETLAHEYLHADYSLQHPDGNNPVTVPPTELGYDPFLDTDNLMYYDKSGRTDTKLRKMQWEKIHK